MFLGFFSGQLIPPYLEIELFLRLHEKGLISGWIIIKSKEEQKLAQTLKFSSRRQKSQLTDLIYMN